MGRICLLGFFLALYMSCCMKNKHYTVFYQLYCLVLKIFQLTVLKCSINTYLISLPREYHAHFAGTVCSAKLRLWVDNNTENEPPVSFLALEKKIQIFTEKCSITVTNRFHFNVWTFMRLCFLSLTLRKPLFSFYLLFFFFLSKYFFHVKLQSHIDFWRGFVLILEMKPHSSSSIFASIFCFRESQMLSSEWLGDKTW